MNKISNHLKGLRVQKDEMCSVVGKKSFLDVVRSTKSRAKEEDQENSETYSDNRGVEYGERKFYMI